MQIELDLHSYDHPEEILLKRCEEFVAKKAEGNFRLARIYPLMTAEGNWHCGPAYDIAPDMDLSTVTERMREVNLRLGIQGLLHIAEGWTYSEEISDKINDALAKLSTEAEKNKLHSQFYRELPPSQDPNRRTMITGLGVFLPDGVIGCGALEGDKLVIQRGTNITGRVADLLKHSLGMT